MSWVAPVLAGVGALGGLFGNRPQQTTQQQTTNQQTTTGNYQNTGGGSQTSIALNPLAGAGYASIAQKYMDLINQDPNLAGYQAGRINDINSLAAQQKANTEEALAARGVAGPAVATGVNSVESQRVGAITDVNNQIPLLANQLQQQTLQNAGGFYRGIPTDTYQNYYGGGSTQGQTNTVGTNTGINTSPGNMTGGFLGGLGNILALLAGMNQLPGQSSNSIPVGGFNPTLNPSGTAGAGAYGSNYGFNPYA